MQELYGHFFIPAAQCLEVLNFLYGIQKWFQLKSTQIRSSNLRMPQRELSPPAWVLAENTHWDWCLGPHSSEKPAFSLSLLGWRISSNSMDVSLARLCYLWQTWLWWRGFLPEPQRAGFLGPWQASRFAVAMVLLLFFQVLVTALPFIHRLT